MPVAAPYIARPMRPASTVLSDETFDRLDTLRIMTGMPSRSALMAELIELGLALHEDPHNAILMLIDGLLEVYGGTVPDAEAGSTAGA